MNSYIGMLLSTLLIVPLLRDIICKMKVDMVVSFKSTVSLMSIEFTEILCLYYYNACQVTFAHIQGVYYWFTNRRG